MANDVATMISISERVALNQAQLTAPGAPFELAQDAGVSYYRHAPDILADMIAGARSHGNKEFMVYRGDRWTFDRFFAAADALATQMQRRLGVRAGDTVAIAMRNRPEWGVAFVAATMLGAVPAPLNSLGLRDELLQALTLVTPKVLLCDAERFAHVGQDLAALGCTAVVVAADPAVLNSAVLAFDDMLAAGGAPLASPGVTAGDPALILFTSGATSHAKAVLSTQRAVCQALQNINYIGMLAAMSSPDTVAKIMQRGHPPTTLTAVPLFHVSGLHAQFLSSLINGRRLVFTHRWNVSEALEMIRAERITQFNGAPSMVMQLMAGVMAGDADASSSLGGIGFGGAGLPQRLIDDLLKYRTNVMAGIGFGLTETNGVGAASSGELFHYKPRSAGLLSPIVEAMILDETDNPAPAGQTGEICLRGVTLMQGYLHNPQATEDAMQDGWFRTGDVGYLDQEGFLCVVDRIKDVINRNGEKISSAEIESCLLSHAHVMEAAVFAAPDDMTGEKVVAVVVAKPGAMLTTEDVQAHVAARLAAYKVPAQIYVRSEVLPRNPVGKLLKPVLRTMYTGK
ncbi:long-chain acyl-CoA synthetase [Collimonas sp. OK607]|uniref:class I adenylate-forming enzyme family protein n=1 Tax=Collimonas sp. OK607 TaxID=1798194 RepID=UPI0008EFF7DF|nr:class I adenylate-forming enzyme family protein [Collimonas sp. OK607]SFA82328.1 long-chain acyl-CoA synthetase [Collimonas sp. OK607]